VKTLLAPSWELSTEHAASSYGQPVLVNRGTGEAFGPGDVLIPYPSWGYVTAAMAVARFAKRKRLDADGAALVEKFVGSLTPAA